MDFNSTMFYSKHSTGHAHFRAQRDHVMIALANRRCKMHESATKKNQSLLKTIGILEHTFTSSISGFFIGSSHMRPLKFWSLVFNLTNFSGCGDPLINHVHAAAAAPGNTRVRTAKGVPSNTAARKEAVDPRKIVGPIGKPVPKDDYSGVKRELENRVKLLEAEDLSPDLGKAKIFYTEYLRLLNELIQAEQTEHRDIDPSCPPLTMKVSIDGKTFFEVSGLEYINHGSSSRVYKSDPVESLGGTTLIIKSLAPKKDQKLSAKIKLALLEDEALMMAFKDSRNLVPHTYKWESDKIDQYCHARTIVSENVGATELGGLPKFLRHNPRVIHGIAARALEIIQQLHNACLIHGDIHIRNWLVGDVYHAAETLRMIDFGRVDLFMQPDPANPGRTIPIPDHSYVQLDASSWNPRLLSPWEIRGHRPTRRDDIFRIAEMLVVLSGDSKFSQAVNDLKKRYPRGKSPEFLKGMAKLKNKREFDASVPQLIQNFYNTAKSMRYLGNFDYGKWIEAFRREASRKLGHDV